MASARRDLGGVEGGLVGARALRLLGALLELAEGDEELLRVVALVELLQRQLEDLAHRRRLALLLLVLGPLDPRARVVVARDVPLEDGARALGLVDAHLEAHVRCPRVVVGLPLHHRSKTARAPATFPSISSM